jgi:NAD(P)-dependent dehydrogenase (short-subunit alcohol dehydrogenase family)
VRRNNREYEMTPRVALITCANRGIGRETARQLTRRAFHSGIAARDEGKGQQAAEGIHARGGKATFTRIDSASGWRLLLFGPHRTGGPLRFPNLD